MQYIIAFLLIVIACLVWKIVSLRIWISILEADLKLQKSQKKKDEDGR